MKMYILFKTENGVKYVFNGFRPIGRMQSKAQFDEVKKGENLQAILISADQFQEMLKDFDEVERKLLTQKQVNI